MNPHPSCSSNLHIRNHPISPSRPSVNSEMLKEHFKEIYHGSVFSQPCRLSVPCPSQHGANLGQHPVTSAPRPHHFNKDKQIRHWSMRLQRITSFYLHWQILNPLSSDIFFQDMQYAFAFLSLFTLEFFIIFPYWYEKCCESQHHGCWWLGDSRSQDISSDDIGLILLDTFWIVWKKTHFSSAYMSFINCYLIQAVGICHLGHKEPNYCTFICNDIHAGGLVIQRARASARMTLTTFYESSTHGYSWHAITKLNAFSWMINSSVINSLASVRFE